MSRDTAFLERLLDAKARPDRDVRVLPGLNHLFQPAGTGLPSEYASIDTTMSAAALDAVSDWILRRAGRHVVHDLSGH